MQIVQLVHIRIERLNYYYIYILNVFYGKKCTKKYIPILRQVPRQEPTPTYESLKEFIENGHFNFSPSQVRISFPIIVRICKRLQTEKKFAPIKVFSDVIIDGHHRYISHCYLNLRCEHVLGQGNISCENMFNWKEVALDSIDYDTEKERRDYEERYDN